MFFFYTGSKTSIEPVEHEIKHGVYGPGRRRRQRRRRRPPSIGALNMSDCILPTEAARDAMRRDAAAAAGAAGAAGGGGTTRPGVRHPPATEAVAEAPGAELASRTSSPTWCPVSFRVLLLLLILLLLPAGRQVSPCVRVLGRARGVCV